MMQLQWRDRISLAAGLAAVLGVLCLSIGLLAAESATTIGGLGAAAGGVAILLLQRRMTAAGRRRP